VTALTWRSGCGSCHWCAPPGGRATAPTRPNLRAADGTRRENEACPLERAPDATRMPPRWCQAIQIMGCYLDWGMIGERYGLPLTVISDVVDPTFRFMRAGAAG
jgi:hypothetical protein